MSKLDIEYNGIGICNGAYLGVFTVNIGEVKMHESFMVAACIAAAKVGGYSDPFEYAQFVMGWNDGYRGNLLSSECEAYKAGYSSGMIYNDALMWVPQE